MRSYSPAGLIDLIDQTVTGGDLKFLIGRFRFLSQSRHRPAERATADSQTVTLFQNLHGTLMRNPHLFVQMRG